MAEFEGFTIGFWIKFSVLYILFLGFIWFVPSVGDLSFKWKFTFSIAGIVGIGLALMGKSLNVRGS